LTRHLTVRAQMLNFFNESRSAYRDVTLGHTC
jgi:hypothetical protein